MLAVQSKPLLNEISTLLGADIQEQFSIPIFNQPLKPTAPPSYWDYDDMYNLTNEGENTMPYNNPEKFILPKKYANYLLELIIEKLVENEVPKRRHDEMRRTLKRLTLLNTDDREANQNSSFHNFSSEFFHNNYRQSSNEEAQNFSTTPGSTRHLELRLGVIKHELDKTVGSLPFATKKLMTDLANLFHIGTAVVNIQAGIFLMQVISRILEYMRSQNN